MASAATASLTRLGRFILKELRETLRDRRTILTLVLMPLLVYPLLGITFQKFFVAQFAVQAPSEYVVAFESMADAIQFRDAFSQGNQLLGREIQPGIPVPVVSGEPPDPSLQFLYPGEKESLSVETVVANQQADLGVRITTAAEGAKTHFELQARRGSILGREAREFVEARLQAVNDAFVTEYFQQHPGVTLPYAWTSRKLEGEQVSEFSLATLVPLVLILMTVTGAVYPAIDLTAGERERGTLEALIAAPISRQQILVAKYVAVVTVALLTAVINVLAMIATAYGTGLEQTLFGSAGLSLGLVGQILGLLAVFAGFFSAVILAITSIARSFKEAQAYLIPVMLMSLSPGILALMPGLELTTPLALTPLVNIVILTRDLLDGRQQGALTLMALGSSIGYAGIALSIAARIFGTDAVLYGSAGTWGELWRRPAQSRSSPKLSQGLIALGVLFPGYILLGSVPARLTHLSLSGRLAASALLTVLLFAVWPLLLGVFTRLSIRSGFGLVRSAPGTFVAALLAGLSLWPFAYELEVATVSSERLEVLVDLFRGLERELQQIPLVWKLCTLALVPAVCEELFFRGYLLRAFRTAMHPVVAVLLTAGLFGLFHVLVRDILLFERFLPTALMGVALGWVAQRSNSTLPGMLLHVVHNGSLLLLPLWSPALGQTDAMQSRGHLPSTWLIVAGCCVLVAAALLQFCGRRSQGRELTSRSSEADDTPAD